MNTAEKELILCNTAVTCVNKIITHSKIRIDTLLRRAR